MSDDKINGWNEWAHRVLGDIEKLEDNQETIYKSINENKIEIAVLKTKMALIGILAGALAGAFSSIITGLVLHIIKG